MAAPNTFKVGIIYFNEEFGKHLENRLNSQEPFLNTKSELVELKAEHVAIHEIGLDFEPSYQMLIDRASHYFKHSMGVLMMSSYKGVRVVNNPMSFHYFIANKDLGFYVAHQLGVNVPPTYVLPPKKTKYLKTAEDFRHHRVFDWQKMVDDVGFPCILKPAEGRAAFHVSKARNINELWQQYDGSEERIMTLQEMVPSNDDWQIRCICVGRSIIPIKYIFRENDASEYIFEEGFLSLEQGEKVVNMARVINRAFGYEMNSVEFILDKDGEPWAIDFNNPVPDARREKLGDVFYNDYAEAFVRLARETAMEGETAPYLPHLNDYAEIARRDIPSEERFEEAFNLANSYYEKFDQVS